MATEDNAKQPDPPAEDAGSPDHRGDKTLSYEQARDQLAEVVKRLEAGGLTLEESLNLWERGERLAETCEEWLEGARARLAAALSERAGPADGDETPF